MYKSRLQEICQRKRWHLPEYKVKREGPDHNPCFQATVEVQGTAFQSPDACSSAKQAQNEAAHAALQVILSTSNVLSDVTKGPTVNTPNQQSIQMERESGPVGASRIIESPMKTKEKVLLFKNQLQTYTQKQKLVLPQYIPERKGPPHASRFRCKVVVGDHTFESQDFFPSLKEAENAAAKVALFSLGPNVTLEGDIMVYKNLLQELAQNEGVLFPVYTSVRSGPPHLATYTSKVEVAGKVFNGQEARTKKLAEMNAAKVAYVSLTGGIPTQTISLPPLPSESHGAPQRSLEDTPLRGPEMATPSMPSKWIEVHEVSAELHITNVHHGATNVSTQTESKLPVTSPMLGNVTNNDTTSSQSVVKSEGHLIMGIANQSLVSGDRVVVLPWKVDFTLPPGGEVVFRDDQWIAVRCPKL